jgi:lysyl endopeptidase
MVRRTIFLAVVSVFVLLWGADPANAQKQVQPPSQQITDVELTNRVPLQDVTPTEGNQRLRENAQERGGPSEPFTYGKVLSTDFSPEEQGVWDRLPSGDWLWRMRIQSEEAVSLSLGFSQFELPPGAELFVHGPDDDGVVRGPYRNGKAGRKHHTPLVHGDELIVELRVPSQRRADVNVRIDRVVHGFSAALPSPERQKQKSLRKSGACNVDVACPPGWEWGQQIRSVARYTFEIVQDGQRFRGLCTGSLVNSTGDKARPYFMTAEHCVSTPEVASTMTFYWNYQSRACREPGSDESGEQLSLGDQSSTFQGETSIGATMRARWGNVHNTGSITGKSDLTLVEIEDGDADGADDDADDNEFLTDYNLYMNGWNQENQPTDGVVGIHHPAGHAKRISIDRNPTEFDGWGGSGGDTHLLLGDWEVGTMEGGSSGSPAFNTNKRIVGVLSGGFGPGCAGGGETGGGGDVLYGRVTPGFSNGDYFDTTLGDFLDPKNTGTKTLAGREMSADTEAPGKVSPFELEGGNKESVTLTWEAPGNDGEEGGPVLRYALRYSVNEPISSFEDFKDAQPVRNVPAPKAPGTEQSVTVDVDPDSSYYFGIVAFDDVFRPSSLTTLEDAAISTKAVRVLPVAPNPARQRARTSVVVEKEQSVRVGLYDALGRRVRLLVDRKNAEPYRRIPVNLDVSSLSSGIYFLRAVGETGSGTQKVPVVK